VGQIATTYVMIRPIRELGRVPLHHAWTGGKVRVHVCVPVKLVRYCSSLDELLLLGPGGCLDVSSHWIAAQQQVWVVDRGNMINNIRNEIVARLRSEQVDIINPECRLAESTKCRSRPSENAMSRRPSLRGLAPSAIGSNRI
jgi:hypothetical protein